MSSYRIEVSPNNRAKCQDGLCKSQGVKLTRGEIRFGTWVTMSGTDHGSWRWKHWGCVSGLQVQGLRDAAQTGNDYDWDMIDGYDELGDYPDVQEKIRRVITQGHIDAQDFNGDPDYNVLGKRGIRGRAKRVQADNDDEAAGPASSQPIKRVKAQDDDEEAEPPKKKARSSKSGEASSTPAKKAAKGGRKSKAADFDEEDEAAPEPAQKSAKGGRKGKAAVAKAAEPVSSAPKKRGRKVKAVLADEDEAEAEPAAEEAETVKPAPKKRGRKSKATQAEDDDAAELEPVQSAKAKRGGRKSKEAASFDETETAAPPKKRGRKSAA